MDAAKIERMRLMTQAVACFDMDYHATCKKLRQANWTQLGSGNYGSAWEHALSGDYIIKLCGRVHGDSYPAWAVFCEANPMPGLPETEFCTFDSAREQFMCMMPRYKEITHDLHQEGRMKDVYEEAYGIMECGWMKAGCGKWDSTTNSYIQHVPSDAPEIAAAVLASEFFGGLVDWDFHRGNCMLDERTGLLVFTDPIHQGDNDTLIHKVRTGHTDIADQTRQLVRQDRLVLEGGKGRELRPGLHRGHITKMVGYQAVVKAEGGHEFRFELPKIPAIREDFRHRRFRMPTNLINADFAMLEERALQQQPNIQQLPKGRVAELEGDPRAAAQWVLSQGLKVDEVRELIPHMKDAVVKFHGRDGFFLSKLMAAPVLFNKQANEPLPPVQSWWVPMDVARALIHQSNKEFRMARQFGANPERFMWPPAGMRI